MCIRDRGGPGDVLVADLSFISLRTVLHALLGLVVESGHLVVLVKPQFEAGKADVDRGRGVIRDPAIWTRTLTEVCAAFAAAGAAIMDVMVSPIRGGDGNVEFLVHAKRGAAAARPLDELVARALGEVESTDG